VTTSDTRAWRVGTHYGVHVYAVNPDGDDEPIASVLGSPEQAKRIAKQIVAEHSFVTTLYFDEQHRGGFWIDLLMAQLAEIMALKREITRLKTGIRRPEARP
jgi:hypothetical protein